MSDTNIDLVEHQQAENTLSFDEIESLTSEKTDAEALEEAKAEVQKAEEAPSTKEDKNITNQTKTESEKPKEGKDLEQADLDDHDSRVDALAEEATEELVEELKMLKAKRGDNEYEMPEDAVFNIKVDGEDMEVSLTDLRNNFAGKVPWDKRYQQLSQEKQDFNKEKTLIERYVNEFSDLVGKGDRMGAMEYLASLSGQNPLEFRKALREQILREHQEYLSMDETQRALYEKDEELKFVKKVQESESQRRADEEADYALKKQLTEIQEAHNISDKDLLDAYDELAAHYDGEITPEIIGEYHVRKTAFGTAEEVLSMIDEKLASDETVIQDVAEAIVEHNITDFDDLEEVIRDAYDIPKEAKKKAGSKKAEKAAKEPKKEEKPKTQHTEVDAFFFDDLED